MANPIDGPRLDRKIVVERFTSTIDEASGEQVKTWATLGPAEGIWANRRDVSDTERVASSEVAAEITTRFIIRYDSAWADLSPLDRLTHEGRTYEIAAVKVSTQGRRQFFEISARTRAE